METPTYRYNLNLLGQTLREARSQAERFGYHLHYALKANSNYTILQQIAHCNLGADCVSGNEVAVALEAGFPAESIVFAGVGKTNREIELAIDSRIRCIHVESLEELQVVSSIAEAKGVVVPIALRLNPNIDAGTHRYITTGIGSSKFGLSTFELALAMELLPSLGGVEFIGFHMHIGSQICDLKRFELLARFANGLYKRYRSHNIRYINLGGGLGIDYASPSTNSIPNFKGYFETFANHLQIPSRIEVHFEPGRSIVGQCGDLITQVLYIKRNEERLIAVVDAGMNNLIRPALYQAQHVIECLHCEGMKFDNYDVVGPVCESSDTFARNIQLPRLERGMLLAIRSAGAYGESMSSSYNLRPGVGHIFEGNEVELTIR